MLIELPTERADHAVTIQSSLRSASRSANVTGWLARITGQSPQFGLLSGTNHIYPYLFRRWFQNFHHPALAISMSLWELLKQVGLELIVMDLFP